MAVVNEYDDFAPLTNNDVNKIVTDRARKSKAGDELVKQYQPKAGKDGIGRSGYGRWSPEQPQLPFRPQLAGARCPCDSRIAGSQPGKVVVVKGDDGVYAYRVTSTATEKFPYSEQSSMSSSISSSLAPTWVKCSKALRRLKIISINSRPAIDDAGIEETITQPKGRRRFRAYLRFNTTQT